MRKSGLALLYDNSWTVFRPRDLALLWDISNGDYLKTKIAYYLKKGYLHRVCHGLYSKKKDDFDILEAGNKLRSPSYASFETVLFREGIIFQPPAAAFFAADFSKTIRMGSHDCVYRKIKDAVLSDRTGITDTGTCAVAIKERAFVDTVYLDKDRHFDNLRPLDWDKVFTIADAYGSDALKKRLKGYHDSVRQG